MLKGTQNAANNVNKEGLRKEAAVASGRVMPSAASVRGLGTQGRYTNEPEEESDKEDTESDEDPPNTKGKGSAKGAKKI